jgi:hypothetical protein
MRQQYMQRVDQQAPTGGTVQGWTLQRVEHAVQQHNMLETPAARGLHKQYTSATGRTVKRMPSSVT